MEQKRIPRSRFAGPRSDARQPDSFGPTQIRQRRTSPISTTTLSPLVSVTERPEPATLDNVVALSRRPDAFWGSVVIRKATVGDAGSLARLAQLDSATPPAGETLIGELQGRPVVAVSLSDGTAIADPFVPTDEILELVRLRTRQLSAWPPRRATRRR
jgi:hypothetical protein